jgi:hypothetical protein
MQSLIDSPTLREQMGVASRERAQLFSSEIVVPKFEQFFAEVVAKSR